MKKVLRYLSTKTWFLRKDYKEVLKNLEKSELSDEERKQFNNYSKIFKDVLRFNHDTKTYNTQRIYAKYVLLPNKPINGIYLKELIIPEPGYVFVSFDYKTSQIRHLASYLGINWLLEAFKDPNYDIYQNLAKIVKIPRKQAKLALLLLMYGGNEKTIMKQIPELSKETAKQLVKQHEEWFDLGEYNYKERKELARTIQKIEAEFIKEKLKTLYKMQDMTTRLHSVTHDEIVMEIHKRHLGMAYFIKEKLEEPNMVVEMKKSETYQFKE